MIDISTADGDTPDPDALPPHAYHRIVGPALQVAAETAAKRGHKHLFDDIPAMLALVDIVVRLADLYTSHYPEATPEHSLMLEQAPTAACVMVFRQAGLDNATIGELLKALEAGYAQAQSQEVLAGSERYVAMAFVHLDESDRDQAHHCLTQACEHVIAAVEIWQSTMH